MVKSQTHWTLTPLSTVSDRRFNVYSDGRKRADGDGEGKTHRERHNPDLTREIQENSHFHLCKLTDTILRMVVDGC